MMSIVTSENADDDDLEQEEEDQVKVHLEEEEEEEVSKKMPTSKPTVVTNGPSGMPSLGPITDSPTTEQPTYKLIITDNPTRQPSSKPVTDSPTSEPTTTSSTLLNNPHSISSPTVHPTQVSTLLSSEVSLSSIIEAAAVESE